MKKQMKKQKMKLLLISLFLIWVWSCKNVVNDNTEKDPQNESLSIESDTISDTISDNTISNAEEHCDFDSFIKEEMGYTNGVFNSRIYNSPLPTPSTITRRIDNYFIEVSI